MEVSARFDTFLSNITLTENQRLDGRIKHSGVRLCLNQHYYRRNSSSDNSLLVGSWGKSTQMRPPRDIDVLFVLPPAVYDRFQTHLGNKQSQLLQEVKTVLLSSYPTTTMRADGQVVVVPFVSYGVEVVPAFALQGSGQFRICDTNNGGRYKTTDPRAEINAVGDSNTATSGNTRDLIRMLKCWQRHCNVPLKSFVLELLALDFLEHWEHRGKTSVYYDWLVRDFFASLTTKSSGYVLVPGTWDTIWLGDAWISKAQSAHNRAVKACGYQSDNDFLAGLEWQKIFGTDIPLS